MAYSDFKINDIKTQLQLTVNERTSLFRSVPPVPASAWLTETLQKTLALALQIGTEKARSELIIAPVLVEFRALTGEQVSLFSGVLFNVDPGRGLTGFCDFIISRSPEQLTINAPALVVIEAKNENINAGVPHCLAAMYAGRVLNERTGQPSAPVYGVVTTGTNWRFLKLEGSEAFVDQDEYFVSQVDKLLGIFVSMMGDSASFTAAQKAA